MIPSNQSWIGAAVEPQVLARNIPRMDAAQKRECGTEFFCPAETFGRDRLDLQTARLFVGHILPYHRRFRQVPLTLGIEPLGQHVVDGDVVFRDIERKRFQRGGQAGARAGRKRLVRSRRRDH